MRIRPHRVHHVPQFAWSAHGRWTFAARPIAVLLAGLWAFGTGEALIIAARLGNSPWSVLADGLAHHTPLDIGGATVVISVLVLLGWVPLGERPGLGTIANAVVIGIAVDVMGHVLPSPDGVSGRLVEAFAGIATVAVGGALYLSTHLGPGPRDGWMTGLARRLDKPIARVRLTIEATVLVAGWLLGGRLGLTTFAFALLIGHTLAIALGMLSRLADAGPRQVLTTEGERSAAAG